VIEYAAKQLGEYEMVLSHKYSEGKQLNLRTVAWSDLTWVDIVQPTKDATEYLAEHYNFHPMDLEDSLSIRQLSKIEEYPQYLFIIFHFQVYEKTTRVSTRKQWSAFVGDKFLITLHPVELKTIDDMFRECELTEETRQEYLSRGSGYLLYQILDRSLDSYFPVLDKIASSLSDIEDSVFSEELEAAQELSTLRRDIITQRQIMLPTRTLLMELENKLKRFTKIDLTVYFSDLMDHINKICENLDENREVVEVFKDADFILSSYRANRGIRIISVMLAIGLPLLAVFGLYGMYSILYGGVSNGSPQIFFLLLAIVFVIVGVISYFFRRRHLI
jgi:magnesium transporter